MKPNEQDYVVTYDEVCNIIHERIEAIDSVEGGSRRDYSIDDILILELEAAQSELYRLNGILRRLRDKKFREYKRQLKLGGYDE